MRCSVRALRWLLAFVLGAGGIVFGLAGAALADGFAWEAAGAPWSQAVGGGAAASVVYSVPSGKTLALRSAAIRVPPVSARHPLGNWGDTDYYVADSGFATINGAVVVTQSTKAETSLGNGFGGSNTDSQALSNSESGYVGTVALHINIVGPNTVTFAVDSTSHTAGFVGFLYDTPAASASSSTPTPAPTATPTPAPTATPTPTPAPSATATPTPDPAASATATPTPRPTGIIDTSVDHTWAGFYAPMALQVLTPVDHFLNIMMIGFVGLRLLGWVGLL